MQGFKDSSCWEQMTLPNNLQSKTFDELFFWTASTSFWNGSAYWFAQIAHTHTKYKYRHFYLLPLFILSFQDDARCPIRLGKKCLYVYTTSLVLDGTCPHLSASDLKILSQMSPYVIKKRDSLAIWIYLVIDGKKQDMDEDIFGRLKRSIHREARISQSRLPPDGNPDGTYDCKRLAPIFYLNHHQSEETLNTVQVSQLRTPRYGGASQGEVARNDPTTFRKLLAHHQAMGSAWLHPYRSVVLDAEVCSHREFGDSAWLALSDPATFNSQQQ